MNISEENKVWIDEFVEDVVSFAPNDLEDAITYALTGKIASLEAEIERLKATRSNHPSTSE